MVTPCYHPRCRPKRRYPERSLLPRRGTGRLRPSPAPSECVLGSYLQSRCPVQLGPAKPHPSGRVERATRDPSVRENARLGGPHTGTHLRRLSSPSWHTLPTVEQHMELRFPPCGFDMAQQEYPCGQQVSVP